MLMEEVKKEKDQEQINERVVHIRNDPVMESAIDVLGVLAKNSRITLHSKGNSIPNAVAVANIITEKMLKGNSKIQKINLDTVAAPGIGSMTSTIEIIINKI